MFGHTLNFPALLALGSLALAPRANGQILHATGDIPSFEVATIKPWKRTLPPVGNTVTKTVTKVVPVSGGGQQTDRIHMIMPLTLLIASAYNLPVGSESRIVGGPDWLRKDNDQFEIQAKIEDSQFAAMKNMSAAKQREQVALMEQSLLADRFGLKVHFETREMIVYALVVTKDGPKLTPAKDGEINRLSTLRNEKGNELTAIAVTLDQFALSPFLVGSVGGLAVDQTGLKGAYDFRLRWGSDPLLFSDAEKETGSDLPAFRTAIQQQLGLRLAPGKAPVEVVVIDNIERPSTN